MNKDNSENIIMVSIRTAPVELYKILKMENLVASGGEAKFVIADGLVTVNGEIEIRKRKKIFPGDVVEFAGNRLQIALTES
ncbi:MAG: RNA-binding S4 domain-containing protein [Desulfobacteraceae bacterium]|nr:RNA-binding S4 domain-containing protein [Desulfobacteraceae bacterium]